MIAALRRIGFTSAVRLICTCSLLAILVGTLAGPASATTQEYGDASTLTTAPALGFGEGLAVSDDGRTLYAVADGTPSGEASEDQLDSISTSDGTFTDLTAATGLDAPQVVAASSQGYVYVANVDGDDVSQLNPDGSPYSSYPDFDTSPDVPTAVATSSDGNTLYVAESGSGGYSIAEYYDLPDWQANGGNAENLPTNLDAPISSLAISPDGDTIYAVSDGTVYCGTSPDTLTSCYSPSSGEAYFVALSTDGETLYVSDPQAHDVFVVNPQSEATLAAPELPNGGEPTGVAASGTTLYALDSANDLIDEWTIPGIFEEPFTASFDGSGDISVAVDTVDGSVTPTYQWYDNGAEIDGATTTTLSSGQYTAGDPLALDACGVDPGWAGGCTEETIMYPGTATIDDNGGPLVDTAPRVGNVLTASSSGWGPAGVAPSFTYTWYVNGSEQSQGSSYKVTGSDEGESVSVVATASESGYATGSATSTATRRVAAGRLTATPKPRITGKPKLGGRLTARAGTWHPGKVHLSYQWLANSRPIRGATRTTLELTRKLRGKRISVRVTGTETGYTKVSETSARTRTVS